MSPEMKIVSLLLTVCSYACLSLIEIVKHPGVSVRHCINVSLVENGHHVAKCQNWANSYLMVSFVSSNVCNLLNEWTKKISKQVIKINPHVGIMWFLLVLCMNNRNCICVMYMLMKIWPVLISAQHVDNIICMKLKR